MVHTNPYQKTTGRRVLWDGTWDGTCEVDRSVNAILVTPEETLARTSLSGVCSSENSSAGPRPGELSSTSDSPGWSSARVPNKDIVCCTT